MIIKNNLTSQALGSDIHHAAQILKQGGVIAYPTEAVFGLGCLANNVYAINKLLKLKKRPVNKGLILLAYDFTQFGPYIYPLEKTILKKIQSTWPGPATWIVPAPTQTSSLIRGQYHSVAIRISAHPIVRALCQQCQSPIISTSANITDNKMTYNSTEVYLQFKDQLDYILEGSLGKSNKPTVIKDALNDKIIRN